MGLISFGSSAAMREMLPAQKPTTLQSKTDMGALELSGIAGEDDGFFSSFGSGLGKGVGLAIGLGFGVWAVSRSRKRSL